MRHAVSRVLAVCALALLAAAGVFATPASATQTPPGPELGWMRLQPATGTIDDAVDGLTQSTCPDGKAIVVAMTGPGIASTKDLGLMVGNTALTALPPTPTNQLWVSLSLTFRDWFGRNVPGFTPAGTYTLTTICRDALKSSVSFGHFTSQVVITKDGKFRALGAAALPFNTTKGEKDPVALPTASSTAGATGPSGTSPSPSTAGGSSTSPAAPAASPQVSSSTGAGTTASTASAPAQAGSGARVALLGLGALLLAAASAVAVRTRRKVALDSTAGRHGADVH